MLSPKLQKIFLIAGVVAIVLFIVIYGFELLPPFGSSPLVSWLGARLGKHLFILLNILIAVAFLFLLPYRRHAKARWRSHGVFVAFVIALMTEMFGLPLLIFLLSPVVRIPIVAGSRFFHSLGPWPGAVGTAISIIGVLLIAVGWVQVYRSQGLVTTGLYRHVRHPQYTGVFLFTLGWVIHWPTVITLLLWPVLIGAYVWLSFREEKLMIAEFSDAYVKYAKRAKRFVPFII